MNRISPLLTDSYQLSMGYSYWKASTHNDITTFELFFRKCPFGGEYVVVGGVGEGIEFIKNYSFTDKEINQLKTHFANWDKEFFNYLKTINSNELKVRAIPDGSIAFPNTPIIQITGPKIICQLLETTLLNITGHPTLIATYSRRIRQQVGEKTKLVEFGLRRAQGETAGSNASKYSWVGGFDGTSNVSTGLEYLIPIVGTHAHSYVMSFTGLEQVPDNLELQSPKTKQWIGDFKAHVFDVNKICLDDIKTNKSELAAFITYAWTQPNNFLALIDTFDTLSSGLENYCFVANTLIDLGYKPKGVRIDSGDLAYLSIKIKEKFNQLKIIYPEYSDMVVVASNDLDEHIVKSLIDEGAQIDMFGIGTKLATSYKSPALGMVYKLVEINNKPRIKLSENIEKMTIPCKKYVFRLYGLNNIVLMDLMTPTPDINQYIDEEGNIFCIDPKNNSKFVKVKYHTHEELLIDMLIDGKLCYISSLNEAKSRCDKQISQMRKDHLRQLNPTPYKVSTPKVFSESIRDIIFSESVIKII
jgi:nicotinate phosphoribosyltransferase